MSRGGRKKLTSEKRLWALRILWAVRRGEIAQDHPDAQKAVVLLGTRAAADAVSGETAPIRRGYHDAMRHRIPGSFEANRRRH
jgi:hypothetical protein